MSRRSFTFLKMRSVIGGQRCETEREVSIHHDIQSLRFTPLPRALLALFCGGLVIAASIELFVRYVVDEALGPRQEEPSLATSSEDTRYSYTGNDPLGHFSFGDFARFQCLTTWVTCFVTGLGSEIVFGYFLLTSRQKYFGDYQHGWFIAQFLFPILILMAVLLARNHNPLGLIFGVAGMWKFGFPETISYMMQTVTEPFSVRVVHHAMNSYGTLMRHCSSVLFMCIFSLGLSPVTRPIFCMSVPLVIQHLFVPMKYFNVPLYALVELCTEIWWEMEIFGNIEFTYKAHGVPVSTAMPFQIFDPLCTRTICAMLLAHWLYWLAAAVEGVELAVASRQRDESAPYPEMQHEPTVKRWERQFRAMEKP